MTVVDTLLGAGLYPDLSAVSPLPPCQHDTEAHRPLLLCVSAVAVSAHERASSVSLAEELHAQMHLHAQLLLPVHCPGCGEHPAIVLATAVACSRCSHTCWTGPAAAACTRPLARPSKQHAFC